MTMPDLTSGDGTRQFYLTGQLYLPKAVFKAMLAMSSSLLLFKY